MQIFKVNGVRIAGVAACVPERKIDNQASLRELYGDEAKLIMESTGIRIRYLANRGTSSSDLCFACAEKLLKGTETRAEEIGGVIFVTFTPDRLMPFNASLIHEKLGLDKEIPAFDISLACSGYAYGLYIASLFVKSSGKKVLLLDGDIQSAHMSQYDKSTVPVMADAGTATLVSPDDTAPTWEFAFYTDGAGRDSLMIPAGGSCDPLKAEHLEYKKCEDGGKRKETDIYMDGFAVFRFVASDVARWLTRFLEQIGESPSTIDSFVPHQANMYMIRKLARKLKFEWERTWRSGDAVGNSASATVPVTIAYDVENRLKRDKENKVLISGFGAGLSASAGVITLDPNAYYEFFQFEGNKPGVAVKGDG